MILSRACLDSASHLDIILILGTDSQLIRLLSAAAKMTPLNKRPLGVTVLALVFLWIGCIGSIALPIIVASGGTTELWETFASGFIRSETLLHLSSFVVLFVWLLLYVMYACIGFGLWKLRDWARRAVLALSALFTCLSVLSLPFFVRPAVLILPTLLGAVLPFAWQFWYLKRPHVRVAFGAVPTLQEHTLVSGIPPKISSKRKMWIATAIFVSLSLFVGTLLFAVEMMFRNSEIYKIALNEARHSQCVATTIGVPLELGWNVSGNMEENSTNGLANLSIPIHGTRGRGDLLVMAEKQAGSWKITSLVLARGAEESQITPGTVTSCQ